MHENRSQAMKSGLETLRECVSVMEEKVQSSSAGGAAGAKKAATGVRGMAHAVAGGVPESGVPPAEAAAQAGVGQLLPFRHGTIFAAIFVYACRKTRSRALADLYKSLAQVLSCISATCLTMELQRKAGCPAASCANDDREVSVLVQELRRVAEGISSCDGLTSPGAKDPSDGTLGWQRGEGESFGLSSSEDAEQGGAATEQAAGAGPASPASDGGASEASSISSSSPDAESPPCKEFDLTSRTTLRKYGVASHPAVLDGPLRRLCLNPATRGLLETADPIVVKVADCNTFDAHYSWKDNVVVIGVAVLRSNEANIVSTLAFELCNSVQSARFKHTVANATDVEYFVREFEQLEHNSALLTQTIVPQIVGGDAAFDLQYVAADFETHYAFNQIAGHSEWIAERYFPSRQYRGSLRHPLWELSPLARQLLCRAILARTDPDLVDGVTFGELLAALRRDASKSLDHKKAYECARALFRSAS
ncbi:hypothetical protein DIPPA_18084 [Diplonema papillatum]|nr:hypothetical protein DIPPA_18084 [Diplonema papillatum]